MRNTNYRRAAAVVAFGLMFAAGTAAFGASGSATSGARVALPGTVPAWAMPADASGTPSPSARITVNVGLNLRDAAGARAFALAVSDPKSKQYGHYLTPARFNAAHAPTDAAVAAVKAFLAGAGLTVGAVAEGNRWVAATGTVAQLDKAFATTVRDYQWRGTALRAPSTTASVPASIAADVMTVTGLDDSGLLRHPYSQRIVADATARPGGSAATPPKATECSTYWGQHTQTVPAAYGTTKFPTFGCGYVASQLRTAYGVSAAVKSGRDGHGVSVAILDAYSSPTILADANKYATKLGEPAFTAGQFTQKQFTPFTLQSECDAAGWHDEQTLDVEALHSIAPGASVHYIAASNCDTGLDTAMNYVVQHHVADIVSNSYGYAGEDVPAAERALDDSMFVQAATEGIGIYFSSGDSGDEVTIGNTTSEQPDFPASDPMVTGVGGTSLAVTSSGAYKFETGWGTAHDLVDFSQATSQYEQPLPGNFLYGAGGGTSTVFAQPAYQTNAVPTTLSRRYGNPAARVVPDLAAVADPYTGFLIGETIDGTFELGTIGGTSLACPIIAGIQALASTGAATPIGFANPLLYSLPAGAFRDVKPTRDPIAVASPAGASLTTFDRDSSLATGLGYDDVTGLGTPDGAALLAAERR
jgi:subtilase family serine protease